MDDDDIIQVCVISNYCITDMTIKLKKTIKLGALKLGYI